MARKLKVGPKTVTGHVSSSPELSQTVSGRVFQSMQVRAEAERGEDAVTYEVAVPFRSMQEQNDDVLIGEGDHVHLKGSYSVVVDEAAADGVGLQHRLAAYQVEVLPEDPRPGVAFADRAKAAQRGLPWEVQGFDEQGQFIVGIDRQALIDDTEVRQLILDKTQAVVGDPRRESQYLEKLHSDVLHDLQLEHVSPVEDADIATGNVVADAELAKRIAEVDPTRAQEWVVSRREWQLRDELRRYLDHADVFIEDVAPEGERAAMQRFNKTWDGFSPGTTRRLHNVEVLNEFGHDRNYDLQAIARWCDDHAQAQFDAAHSGLGAGPVQPGTGSSRQTSVSQARGLGEGPTPGHAPNITSEQLMAQRLQELPSRPGASGPSV